jgi:hypothetical protein
MLLLLYVKAEGALELDSIISSFWGEILNIFYGEEEFKEFFAF